MMLKLRKEENPNNREIIYFKSRSHAITQVRRLETFNMNYDAKALSPKVRKEYENLENKYIPTRLLLRTP